MENNFEKIYGGTDMTNKEGHDYCPRCQRLGASYIEDLQEKVRVWTCPDCGKIPQYM